MMNLKPAIKYQMRDYSDGILVLLVAIIAIIAAPSVIMLVLGSTDQHINFTGFGGIADLFMFVCGIVYLRSGMRMNIQLGISRRTTFTAMVISAVLAALLLSALGTVLMAAAQVLTGYLTFAEFFFADLYALGYLGGDVSVLDMSLAEQGISILFTACQLFCSWAVGAFLSLLFWRLNRFGQVMAVIVMICLPVVIASALVQFQDSEFARVLFKAVEILLRNSFQSPWFAMMLFLITAAVFLVIDWLLVRNVNIRGTGTK